MKVPHPLLVVAAVSAAVLWAAPAFSQDAGRTPALGQPFAGGTTIIDLEHPVSAAGELRVWQAYSTQGGRVMLKVWRPEGDRLVLVGASPLETVPAGEVATFTCRIPVARNDVIGCFCPDDTCVDRFGDGMVQTGTGDIGTIATGQLVSGTGEPALAAAGSRLVDVPSPAGKDLVLPVAARTPGFNGTLWTTALELFNTGTQSASVALFFDRSGVDNTSPAASAQVEVPARGMVVIEDLLLDAFQLEQDVGAVDIVASQPILAHARIANIGSEVGSFGQIVPALPSSWAVGVEDTPYVNPNARVVSVFEIRDDEEFRTNLGVVNTSGVPLTVTVQAIAAEGAVGVPLELRLEPFSHVQVNHVLQELGIAQGTRNVRLAVTPATGSGGRFFAYASRVDNRTGDAVFLLGHGEPPL